MGKVLLFSFLFLATISCRHGRCYRDADCNKSLICTDPEVTDQPAAKRCKDDETRCVQGCVARCTMDSCAKNKICGSTGCCEPLPCKLNGDCRSDDSCVDGKCTSPGRCMEPPEG